MIQSKAPSRRKGFLREGERDALLLAQPPVLVAVLSQFLFDVNAGDILQNSELVVAAVAAVDPSNLIHRLKASEVRSTWNLALMLNLSSAVVLTAVAVVVLWRSVSVRGVRLLVPLGVCLVVLGLGWLAYAAQTGRPIGGIFVSTYASLMASPLYDPSFASNVHLQVNLLNVFSILTPVAALMAACSTVAPPKGGGIGDMAFLGSQVRYLRALMILGSCYMVSGVLHMAIWLGWPASLVMDAKLAEVLLRQAMAITLFWGGGATVLIAAFYAPALIVLSKRAKMVLERSGDGMSTKDAATFLEEHGLSLSFSKQLPEFMVVIAPLLAGPMGSGLASLAGVLPTSG